MLNWWPVNFFACNISKIFFKISQVLILISFCSSASTQKKDIPLLIYAQAIVIILISDISTVMSIQWAEDISPCLSFSSLHEGMMGKI